MMITAVPSTVLLLIFASSFLVHIGEGMHTKATTDNQHHPHPHHHDQQQGESPFPWGSKLISAVFFKQKFFFIFI
jgi:hypothetical protein